MDEPAATSPLAHAQPLKAKAGSEGVSGAAKGTTSDVATRSDSDTKHDGHLSAPVTVNPPAIFTDQPHEQDRQEITSGIEGGGDWSDADSAVEMDIDPRRSWLSDTQSPAEKVQQQFHPDCGQTPTPDNPTQELATTEPQPPEQTVGPSRSNSQYAPCPEGPATPQRKKIKRPRTDKKRRRRRRREICWEDEFYTDSTGHLAIRRDERQNEKRIALQTNPEWFRPLGVCSWLRTKMEPISLGSGGAGRNGDGVPAVKVTDTEGEDWFLEDPEEWCLEDPETYLSLDAEEDEDWSDRGDGEKEWVVVDRVEEDERV
jgi:hypothetical protein